MKVFLYKRLLIFLGLVFTIGLNTLARGECNKIFINGWQGEWEPFVLGTSENPSGLDMEILDSVINFIGCRYQNTKATIPWARAQEMLRHGKIDFLTSASKTKERSEYAHFIGPYRGEYVGIFVRKGESKKYHFSQPEDLLKNNFILGITIGYSYGKRLDNIIKKMGHRVEKTAEYEGNPTLINQRKLMAGHLDGYVGYPINEIISFKGTQFEDKFELHPMALVNTGFIYFMLSKKANSKEIAAKLQKSIENLKVNDTLKSILQKYSKKYGVSQW